MVAGVEGSSTIQGQELIARENSSPLLAFTGVFTEEEDPAAAAAFVRDGEPGVKTISSAGAVASSAFRWQEASEAATTSADSNGKVYLFCT